MGRGLSHCLQCSLFSLCDSLPDELKVDLGNLSHFRALHISVTDSGPYLATLLLGAGSLTHSLVNACSHIPVHRSVSAFWPCWLVLLLGNS